MNNFERTINKWRTATNTNILIDGKNGVARATVYMGNTTVTVLSDVIFEGEPFFIEPDDLKTFKRVDDLQIIHDNRWVGDVSVTVPHREELELKPVEFVEGDYSVNRDDLEYVMLATSGDKSRPVLTGVLFTNKHLVATDGFRLHFAYGEYYQNETDFSNPVLLDSEILKRIKSDFDVTHDNGSSIITFKDRGNQVIIKTEWIKGSFPDYRVIIPDKTKVNFTIPEDNRFKKVKTDEIGVATLDGWFEYETQQGKYRNVGVKTRFTTEIEYIEGKPEKPIEFGISPKILYEAVREWPAKIGLNSPDTPIVIDNAVVMPMHIGDK